MEALELQPAKAKKDSSKSPSIDIAGAGKKKKKNPGRPRKCKAGGQHGPVDRKEISTMFQRLMFGVEFNG